MPHKPFFSSLLFSTKKIKNKKKMKPHSAVGRQAFRPTYHPRALRGPRGPLPCRPPPHAESRAAEAEDLHRQQGPAGAAFATLRAPRRAPGQTLAPSSFSLSAAAVFPSRISFSFPHLFLSLNPTTTYEPRRREDAMGPIELG